MLFTATGPAKVNEPPAWSAGPPPESYTASARTVPLTPLLPPVPSDDQLVPFQRAIRLAVMPPALPKPPPTNSAGPLPSSWTTSAFAPPLRPAPSADQLKPFQRAMWLADTPPTVLKKPAA